MDHNPLVNPGQTLPRGGNGIELGIVRNCLYVPSRSNSQGTLIVDISKPHQSRVAGSIPPVPTPPGGRPLSTEVLAAVESEDLLVRMIRSVTPFGVELFDTTDCFNPVRVSTIPMPGARHEIFIWQGGSPKRVLLFVSFQSGGPPSGPLAVLPREDTPFPAPPNDVDIRVYDITDKRSPFGPVAIWSLQRFGIPTVEAPDLLENGGQWQRNTTHAIAASEDGTRVYVSQTYAGFYLLDSTPLATGAPCEVDPGRIEDAAPGNPFGVNPNACLKKLHPDPRVRLDYQPPFANLTTHSAYKVPGRTYVIINDEPVGTLCPQSWIKVAFVDETTTISYNPLLPATSPPTGTQTAKFNAHMFPAIVGAFMIPEVIPDRCPETLAKLPGVGFNAHKSLAFRNLVFVAWNGGGLRAIDISNPATTFEAGFFFNKPVPATQAGDVNPELRLNSHPLLKDGLLYVLDVSSGLYVFKYTGPRKEELPEEGLFAPNAIQVPGRLP
jgi:hypothetical protein